MRVQKKKKEKKGSQAKNQTQSRRNLMAVHLPEGATRADLGREEGGREFLLVKNPTVPLFPDRPPPANDKRELPPT